MKRKLVKQGNGALTLTLPYLWTSKNNLKKGDYIDLIQSGKDLILSSESKRSNKEYSITLSKDKPFFKRYLRTCYVLGYDKISLSTEDILPLGMIKEVLSNLIGYEIIEQTTKKCSVAMVATPYENNFDTVLRRLFYMIDSMMKDISESLGSKNLSNLKEIATMETAINSFVDFCLRILNKKGYTEFHKTPYIYQILIELEQMGDALHNFSLTITKTNKNILLIFKELHLYFSSLHTLFYKYDMKKIKKIKEKRAWLYKQIYNEVLTSPRETLDLYLLLTTLHQFEIALDPINN